MTLTKTLCALTLLLVLVPAAAYADHGSNPLAQAGIDIGTDIGVSTDATGTPSDSSAGDDANLDASATVTVDTKDVATNKDIVEFTTALQQQNPDLAGASAVKEENKVVVEYYHNGKFLGFMSVRVKAKTTIESDDSGVVRVATRMPWWNFLVTGTGKVGKAIDGELAASGQVMMDTKIPSATARARVIEAITNAHARAALAAEAA